MLANGLGFLLGLLNKQLHDFRIRPSFNRTQHLDTGIFSISGGLNYRLHAGTDGCLGFDINAGG